MIIKAKDHIQRCPKCGTAVGYEKDSFCHSCGEFFRHIGNRWFDPITEWIDQSLGSLDVQMEGKRKIIGVGSSIAALLPKKVEKLGIKAGIIDSVRVLSTSSLEIKFNKEIVK